MLGNRLGLMEFVQAARYRVLRRRDLQDWFIDVHNCTREEANERSDAVSEAADDVIRLCFEGQFSEAERIADREEVVFDTREPWVVGMERTPQAPAWITFCEVVDFAARIDSFLAVMERGGSGAPLARDCRENLDLLLVLADWCHDAGQPHAAAEARHLHALACSHHKGG